MFLRFAVILVVIISMPTLALASSVVRTGDNISIASDQAVEGDFYGAGNSVSISGEVTGDLLVAGADLNINGKVNSDLAAIAGTVDLDGVVADDARIIGGEVTISGEVDGDLVVVASSLKVLSTAKIKGDIIFFGSEADISGEVGKSIFGTSERIRIDGVVGGDIDVKTAELVLGERTDVVGMVKYTSASELIRAQNARVAGKVVKNDPVVAEVNNLKEALIPILVILFAALVWFLFFRRMLDKVVLQANNNFVRNTLIGFGILFLIPVAVGILIMSTLGSLLGITLFFIYLALIMLSVILSGVVAGSFISRVVTKSSAVTIPYILIGTVTMLALLYVPVVGSIVLLGILFTTLGALATYLYRLIRLS